MNDQSQLPHLLQSLEFALVRVTAGSAEEQFPILDLVGNIRDEAGKALDLVELRASASAAWERLVRIVEAGQPFTPEHVQWLQTLGGTFSRQAGLLSSTESSGSGENGLAAGTVGSEHANINELTILLNISQDAELLREFLVESREHLDNIEQGVLVLEQHPADSDTLNTIFRAFHTFKGSAGFLNLLPINRLAHVLETLLDLIRQHKLAISTTLIELILRGRDTLKLFLDAIEAQVTGTQPLSEIVVETARLKAELESAIESASAVPSLVSPQHEPRSAVPAVELSSQSQPQSEPAPSKRSGPTPAPERGSDHGSMVKVDTGKLDALLDLIGEMVISQSLVSPTLNQLAERDPQFARNIAQLSRITKELQRVGMSMRMVPVRGVFQKMARVVRDIAAKQNKRVQLLTSGEDTELDRGVVEELNDPLLHMIRNSVDHGIETEDVRLKSGKPAVGTIHLRAFHQGGNIAIEIEDDGAGLNRDRILAKAVERGLVSSTAQPRDEEIFSFIFAAGFSTAEKVTEISGRGVGLDVVRRNLEKLRGCVDISSTAGRGSRFKIGLPLTLAIIDGLVVRVGNERYIIPTLSVRESFRARPEMITRIQNRMEVVDVRGRLIPLLRLHQHFGLTPRSTDLNQNIIIVLQSGSNFRCVLVDSLESKQEVVIKNLNDILIHKHNSLAGAAILGDGRVGLILDVNSLVQLDAQRFEKAA